MKEKDELLKEAIQAVRVQGKASASLLQRTLRVGYFRAAKLLDAMEEAGVVAPVDPKHLSVPRVILPIGESKNQ